MLGFAKISFVVVVVFLFCFLLLFFCFVSSEIFNTEIVLAMIHLLFSRNFLCNQSYSAFS